MPIEFDVKITANDMYRFNMYHIYTSFTGILSILAAVLGFVAAVGTYGKVDTMYTVLYIIFGIVFLFYFPLTLKMRAARQISMSEALKSTLHYMLDDEGVHVSLGEENALLEWKQIYKMVSTKHNVLIYSSRVNAYILPMEIVGGQYAALKELADKNLKKHQNCMKKR